MDTPKLPNVSVCMLVHCVVDLDAAHDVTKGPNLFQHFMMFGTWDHSGPYAPYGLWHCLLTFHCEPDAVLGGQEARQSSGSIHDHGIILRTAGDSWTHGWAHCVPSFSNKCTIGNRQRPTRPFFCLLQVFGCFLECKPCATIRFLVSTCINGQ